MLLTGIHALLSLTEHVDQGVLAAHRWIIDQVEICTAHQRRRTINPIAATGTPTSRAVDLPDGEPVAAAGFRRSASGSVDRRVVDRARPGGTWVALGNSSTVSVTAGS